MNHKKTKPMLSVNSISKRYGSLTAVRDLSFDVAPGQVVGLLGANGAGKTTTVEIISGLTTPDGGSVAVDGKDVGAHTRWVRQRIGLAPQETGVYTRLTARQNLEFFARLLGHDRRQARRRADELLEQLALVPVADRLCGLLSGGEARRVHVGIALIHRAPLLLLDEPTVGMDVRTRAQVLDLITSAARAGAAVCFSSHYLTEVEHLCDEVVVLHRGVAVAQGPVSEIVAQHSESAVELVFDDDHREQHRIGDVRSGLPSLLERLGDRVARLRSIDVKTASLETAFLALTHEDTGTTETTDTEHAAARGLVGAEARKDETP
ncbi:MAG: ABC transporter ATP-binding protein [Pseudonocardiaceae bacterium]